MLPFLMFMCIIANLSSMFNVVILTFMFIVAIFTTMGSQLEGEKI